MTEDLFRDVILRNQRVWDKNPDRAHMEALESIGSGGFDENLIRREVGNYEGQIMAARNGWVDKINYTWVITDKGLEALKISGKPVPNFLSGIDSWHDSEFEYCVYEVKYDDKPALRLFKEPFPKGGSLGMNPILRRCDVVALHKMLGNWIEKTNE